ncbi:NAD(P)/FAD-dependent oxidoreductase [Paeniglutamicibacter terrestris]|uniref:NAD(P)/FAD-dependent oxidoreductase n=1 Tax=Paeniglutamicibacter terrestris TaxID=2723403 RepID=A0ABX1G5D9_9MICC|nr:NAD(P)/FAD-dependent oxidoreductase [Paeniglutamicibacter terrestris]NKG20765.1 NAD(P)/FAD-dependent oxidoreductase [Paeniglutamicibacter terrestris]
MNTNENFYDVAIIGGGAAGLAAAQALGRSRRSVVVIDAGQPRNAVAKGVHNFLTRDGVPPLELLRLGREELAPYGTEFRFTRATSYSRGVENFEVTLEEGAVVTAGRIILAAGIRDTLPEIDGLEAFWGKNVLHCPYCHGWEVQDQNIAVLDSEFAIHQALMFRQLSDSITLYVAPGREIEASELEKLKARGIKIVEREIIAVRGSDNHLTHLGFADGTEDQVDALVIMPRFSAEIPGLTELGLQTTDHPSGIGTYVSTDEFGKTEVPGLWVAGSLREPMAQVVLAAGDGLRVGAMVNADIIESDIQRDLTAHRAALPVS